MQLKILEKLIGKKDVPPIVGTRSDMMKCELAEHIEMYAAAFLKETGLNPCDVVLEQTESMHKFGYEYVFRKKTPQEVN
jgi:hypothetical protein